MVAAVLIVAAALAGCAGNGGGSNQESAAPVADQTAQSSAAERPIDPPAGWQDTLASMQPNGDAVSASGLSLQVMGDCSSNGGNGMLLMGSGFPANGSYLAQVTNPGGTQYEFYNGNGRFDLNGQPSGWDWNCNFTNTNKRDPAGTYTLMLQDVTPGSPTEGVELRVPFEVSYPNG